jgi:hypothetical protein
VFLTAVTVMAIQAAGFAIGVFDGQRQEQAGFMALNADGGRCGTESVFVG